MKFKTIEELKAAYEASNDNFLRKVLAHNIKAVAINGDVINAVVDAVNKYTGKKIGEKTVDKINSEIQKTYPEIRVYFDRTYSIYEKRTGLVISSSIVWNMFSYDDSKVTLYSKDGWSVDLFDDDSKFKGLDKDTMRVSGKVEYIEDMEKYINHKKEQFEAVKAAAKKYLDACSDFDQGRVKGMADLPHVYVPSYITK